MNVVIERSVQEFIGQLPDKDKRIIGEHIDRLTDYPNVHGDTERFKSGRNRWRMHIAYKYTAFYTVKSDHILVDILMPIGAAHKKYGKI